MRNVSVDAPRGVHTADDEVIEAHFYNSFFFSLVPSRDVIDDKETRQPVDAAHVVSRFLPA